MRILPVDEEIFSIPFHAGVHAGYICVLQFLPLNGKNSLKSSTISLQNFLELTQI